MTKTENPDVVKGSEAVNYFTPDQDPPAGTFLEGTMDKFPPRAFQPVTIRGQTFQNRVWVSPMCQYSYKDGFVNEWTLVQIGSYATRGASLSIIEATAVSSDGVNTIYDAGIWKDEHIEGIKRVADYVHSQGQKIGIQFHHSGRKGSVNTPWKSTNHPQPGEGGWEPIAPSALKYAENFIEPKEMTRDDIDRVIDDFKQAAVRAGKADVDVVDIHGAHGYLINSFLSEVSNKRTDEYGGSFENRMKFLLDIVKAVKSVLPEKILLFVRLSASDRLEYKNEGITIHNTIELAAILKTLGVDVIDVSSGGVNTEGKIEHKRAFQAEFAYDIKKAVPDIGVTAVGAIHSPNTIEDVLSHDIDAVLVGRPYLQNPSFLLELAKKYGVKVQWPIQMGYTNRFLLPLEDDESFYINN